MTFQVDKLHCQAADLTETGQSGRICAHNKSFGGNFISYHKDVVNRVGYGFFKIFSFRPRMHTYKQCRRRRFCTAWKYVVARNRNYIFNARGIFANCGGHLVCCHWSPVQRSSFRHHNRGDKITLIFIGNKSWRQNFEKKTRQAANNQHKNYRKFCAGNDFCDNADVRIFCPLKPIIKCVKKFAEEIFLAVFVRFKNHRAKCRSQSKSDKSRQAHRNRDCQRELSVQNSCHSAQKSYRNENCRQNKRDCHNRTLNFRHRNFRRLNRI